MDALLQSLCDNLDKIGSQINESTLNVTFTENWDWSYPPLSKKDLADMVSSISTKVKNANIAKIPDNMVEPLENILARIYVFNNAELISHLTNSNARNAMVPYISLIYWINLTLEPLFDWQFLLEKNALPIQLTRRLNSIKAEIDLIAPDKEGLEKQMKLIKEATEAAESLPTDLQSLKEARQKVDKFSTESAEAFGKIDNYRLSSQASSLKMDVLHEQAERIVAQCEEAYKITTTKGLAAAFDQRARRLNHTVWIWVVGLLIALIAGGFIGASRFDKLTTSLNATNLHWGVIWMDFGLSVVGLAAPVWFAWLATKQIAQRFRLSEDYAFKASVAKAYEGYRKEAARIDESFEARLFSSALSRLEEAPLRLVDGDNYSNPWQEFFNSASFQKAIDTIPDLKEKFFSLSKDGVSILKKKFSKETEANTPNDTDDKGVK